MEARHAADLPAAEWDALVGPEDFFLGSRWLKVAERTAQAPMRYLVRRRAGRVVAALATALGTGSSRWVLGRPDTLLRMSVEAGRPGAAHCLAGLGGDPAALLPSLVCGGRHIGRSRVLRADPADVEAVTELVARGEQLAAEMGAASVAFPFVDGRDTLLRQVLSRRGYVSHVSGRYSWLPVPADGFDGYLAAMPRKRRQMVLAERRRVATAGVAVDIRPLTVELVPRLAELEAQLMAKYGIAWTPAQTADTLHEMLAVFGPAVDVCLAVAEGEVRGFATLLRHQDQWYVRQTGFDYAYQGRLPLYFEVAYYRPVTAAAGITGIHYGLGSEQAKRLRGCLADEQHAYLLRLPCASAGQGRRPSGA